MLSKDAKILIDISRTMEDCINYDAIEKIKNGLICNMKYETGSFICNSPNICIMANCIPKIGAMTIDRWKIYTINNNTKELLLKNINK